MSEPAIDIKPPTWASIRAAVATFMRSEVRGKAIFLFCALVTLMLGINGLNVLNSYVGRDFFSAIEGRDSSGFVRLAWIYAGVFVVSTVVAVLFRFVEERLGLLWREWLTRRLLDAFLEKRVYFRLLQMRLVANPDQNIAEDVKAFTTTTLSFVLMVTNGSFTALAFSTVLFTVSAPLFCVAVAYAAFGTVLTVLLGRPLVTLNYRQLDREAEFRAELVHVRENTESIALLGREGRIRGHLLAKLDGVVANWRRVIAVNRNLSFFTTGYNYMIQLIPALMIAPLFIEGEVQFGVIAQAAMAFAQLMGAFSLIVTQFQSISSYTAVIARLGKLAESIRQTQKLDASLIELCEGCGVLGYEHLTLSGAKDGPVLVKDIDLMIQRGTNVLIDGPNDGAKAALFRATAGIWEHGTGKVIRPPADRIAFLTERPYLHPGTLRETLVHTRSDKDVSDDKVLEVLRRVGLESLDARVGGLHEPQDWDDMLPLGAQQLLIVARLLISREEFAVMDRIATALSGKEVARVLGLLRNEGITYVTFGNSTDDPALYDAILDIAEDGSWSWRRAAAAPPESAPPMVAT